MLFPLHRLAYASSLAMASSLARIAARFAPVMRAASAFFLLRGARERLVVVVAHDASMTTLIIRDARRADVGSIIAAPLGRSARLAVRECARGMVMVMTRAIAARGAGDDAATRARTNARCRG